MGPLFRRLSQHQKAIPVWSPRACPNSLAADAELEAGLHADERDAQVVEKQADHKPFGCPTLVVVARQSAGHSQAEHGATRHADEVQPYGGGKGGFKQEHGSRRGQQHQHQTGPCFHHGCCGEKGLHGQPLGGKQRQDGWMPLSSRRPWPTTSPCSPSAGRGSSNSNTFGIHRC